MTTRNIESQLELLRLNTGREVPVVAANRLLKQMLFRYQVSKAQNPDSNDLYLKFNVSCNSLRFIQS